jgi:SAM-dependent methyltransferase
VICHLCGSTEVREVAAFSALPRVTSDCRPWPNGGRVAACSTCGLVQNPIDAAYRAELTRIYDGYAIYAQSGGVEQKVLDAGAGTLGARSDQVLAGFLEDHPQPASGRWLDVGCGNGAMLRAMSQRLTGWRSIGTELDDRHRSAVESIAGVERLHVGGLDDLAGRFDVVSLLHVLEHVETPATFLADVARLLEPDGMSLIESPLSTGNPFDLAIADHVSHFEEATLRACIERAGLTCVRTGRRFLDREVFATARLGRVVPPPGPTPQSRRRYGLLLRQVAWLNEVAERASQTAGRPFGIFGSSIAATFAFACRNGDVDFFLDEDETRVGRTHLGIPILPAGRPPENAVVYVPLPPQLAKTIVSKPGRASWILPPDAVEE